MCALGMLKGGGAEVVAVGRVASLSSILPLGSAAQGTTAARSPECGESLFLQYFAMCPEP